MRAILGHLALLVVSVDGDGETLLRIPSVSRTVTEERERRIFRAAEQLRDLEIINVDLHRIQLQMHRLHVLCAAMLFLSSAVYMFLLMNRSS